MMHSVFVMAALLAAASKGLETTYTMNFASPQAFAQGGYILNETTVHYLGMYPEISYVSSAFVGTAYTITIDEGETGSSGQAMCQLFPMLLAENKELCFIDGVSAGETSFCTVSSFENYAEQCTSNVPGRYYLTSTMIGQLDKTAIDALIMKMISNTLVRYVSSALNDTHYTLDVTEPQKSQFATEFCIGTSTLSYPGDMCYVTSISDDEQEFCKPSEGPACQEYTSKYVVSYPIALASQFTKAMFDQHVTSIIAQMGLQDPQAANVGSYLDAQEATYYVYIKESNAGTFGEILKSVLMDNEDMKCSINDVSLDDQSIYTTPLECLSDVPYVIRFPVAALPQLNKTELDGMINDACDLFVSQGVQMSFINSTLDQTGTYTVFVNEQFAGSLGNFLGQAIGANAQLKCLVSYVMSGEQAFYVPVEECYTYATYEIKIPSAAAADYDQATFDGQALQVSTGLIEQAGVVIGIVNSTYDDTNGYYRTVVKEVYPGSFGDALVTVILADQELQCAFTHVKKGEEELFARPDVCYETTVYKFGLSINKPATVTKDFIDNLVFGFMDNEAIIYQYSNYTDALYALTVKELVKASLSGMACGQINALVAMSKVMCHITFIGYDNVTQCSIRTHRACMNTDPGVTTEYEVKYYGNLSTKEELDALFEKACEYARDAVYENVRFVNSTYKKNTYKPMIIEPVVGIFGNHFCQYTNKTSIRCDFGSLKAGGNDFCHHPDCKNAAFGFTPLAFFMALIIAFLF